MKYKVIKNIEGEFILITMIGQYPINIKGWLVKNEDGKEYIAVPETTNYWNKSVSVELYEGKKYVEYVETIELKDIIEWEKLEKVSLVEEFTFRFLVYHPAKKYYAILGVDRALYWLNKMAGLGSTEEPDSLNTICYIENSLRDRDCLGFETMISKQDKNWNDILHRLKIVENWGHDYGFHEIELKYAKNWLLKNVDLQQELIESQFNPIEYLKKYKKKGGKIAFSPGCFGYIKIN